MILLYREPFNSRRPVVGGLYMLFPGHPSILCRKVHDANTKTYEQDELGGRRRVYSLKPFLESLKLY
jgi:hypothetical protein